MSEPKAPMKVPPGRGGIRRLAVDCVEAMLQHWGTGRTANQPSRTVISVIRLLCMYFERRAHISAAFATERESSLKEINTVERCNRASLSFMLIHLENIPGRKPNNIHSTHSRWVFLKFESGCKWGSGYSRISHNHKVKSGHWRAEWHFTSQYRLAYAQ